MLILGQKGTNLDQKSPKWSRAPDSSYIAAHCGATRALVRLDLSSRGDFFAAHCAIAPQHKSSGATSSCALSYVLLLRIFVAAHCAIAPQHYSCGATRGCALSSVLIVRIFVAAHCAIAPQH